MGPFGRSRTQRYLAARIAYVAIVLLATLTNLDFSADTFAASARLTRALSPAVSWRDVIDGLRNAALFAGLGGVWVLTSLTGKVRREMWMATGASFALSTIVETAQLFSPIRNASLIDVATNTLGGLAGAVATVLLLVSIHSARGKKSYVGIPTLLIAGPYVAAVVCEALTPLFESTPIASIGGGPLARLAISLSMALPLDWKRISPLDIPLFAGAGFALIALVRERRSVERKVSWMPALPFIPVIIAAHVAHGMMGLPIRWEAVVVDSLAVLLGAVLADRLLGTFTQLYRGADRARLFIFSYSVLLMLWGWRPLWPETRWSVIAGQLNATSLTPLAGLAERADAFSAIHVAQQFLLYVPLGAILAVWPLRRRGPLAHLWPAAMLAMAIELGHIVIYDRSFDITNILLALAALAMGWVAVRRCGYRPYGDAISTASPRARHA